LAGQVFLDAAAASQSGRAEEQRIDAVQDALLRLPYYGVFDFLTFTYDRGKVTVDGYAYHTTLGADAERALRRVPGVDAVEVKVTVLPPSAFDDEIRWRVFYAIYTNAFLAKYAPAGGILWGHRHPLRRRIVGPFDDFPGMQPVGNYPVHIVVERSRVRLLGVVDSEVDKTVAGMAARQVGGTFAVENELVIDQR
jgi:hypothetical protein